MEQKQLQLEYLSGYSVSMLSSFIRATFAAGIQKLMDLLSNCWTFSVPFDTTTVQSLSLPDGRLRFAVESRLFCFQLILIPLNGLHIRKNMFHAFAVVFDIVAPRWRDILLSVSMDTAMNVGGPNWVGESIIVRAMEFEVFDPSDGAIDGISDFQITCQKSPQISEHVGWRECVGAIVLNTTAVEAFM